MWELIGVASYLLIGFWLTRVQANKSAVKAITVNRVGDAVISVGFFTLLCTLSTLDYAPIMATAPYVNETTLVIIGLLLFGGAMSKSAQVPLHGWLPDAMEGCIIKILVAFIGVLLVLTTANWSSVDSDYLIVTQISTISFILGQSKETNGILTGCILGDGHIRRNKRKIDPKGGPYTGGARYAITMKKDSLDYIISLYDQHFSQFSNTSPKLWPNPETGKDPYHCCFNTRTSLYFTELHKA